MRAKITSDQDCGTKPVKHRPSVQNLFWTNMTCVVWLTFFRDSEFWLRKKRSKAERMQIWWVFCLASRILNSRLRHLHTCRDCLCNGMIHRRNKKISRFKSKTTMRPSKMDSQFELPPSRFRVHAGIVFYVLSGTSQPLVVTLLKEAGLADPLCQLFMLSYYIVPALFLLPLLLRPHEPGWPSHYTILKACGYVNADSTIDSKSPIWRLSWHCLTTWFAFACCSTTELRAGMFYHRF